MFHILTIKVRECCEKHFRDERAEALFVIGVYWVISHCQSRGLKVCD